MLKTRIPISEFTYRGLETIEEPDELCRVFETVIKALPQNIEITKERCWEEFSIAWELQR